jgi:DnaJ like chaperone protein
MGHVAKSDGRVTEAEIDAARQLMRDLNLGAREISIAIAYFRAGKSAAYDAELGVERLREACGQRYDLLRAFMELQLRAALAGNGLSPPARAVLTRVAARGLRRRWPPRRRCRVAGGVLCGTGSRCQYHRSRSDQGISAPNEPSSS